MECARSCHPVSVLFAIEHTSCPISRKETVRGNGVVSTQRAKGSACCTGTGVPEQGQSPRDSHVLGIFLCSFIYFRTGASGLPLNALRRQTRAPHTKIRKQTNAASRAPTIILQLHSNITVHCPRTSIACKLKHVAFLTAFLHSIIGDL